MVAGTTPKIKYKLQTGIDFEKIKQIWVTLKSVNAEITKVIDDVELDNSEKTVSFMLTQEETLSFNEGSVIETQIRLLVEEEKEETDPPTDPDEEEEKFYIALASECKTIPIYKVLKGGVIE